eukprot:TRINITY_DN82336_c0_g1_i1.p1 TRINITY_DN82336_c0_g1~~TRINITY_DN82336_c0_g1_i1.p1  ORF type:complete len:417 (-),score=69.29 TRINITY_DN82336_c0_g1_i1:42-1292(-)
MGAASCACSASDLAPVPEAVITTASHAEKQGNRLSGGSRDSWVLIRGSTVQLRWMSGSQMVAPLVEPRLLRLPTRVAEVAAGASHALLLAEAGGAMQVLSIGANQFGQLGLGDTKARDDQKPFAVRTLPDHVEHIACGGHVSMAVVRSGALWTWGRNGPSGTLGHGEVLDTEVMPTPSKVACLQSQLDVCRAATNGFTSLCISDVGSVASWGSGEFAVHGHGHEKDVLDPKIVDDLDRESICQAAMGRHHAIVLARDGGVWAWGLTRGAFGDEKQDEFSLRPRYVDALQNEQIVQVAAGYKHSLALAISGEVYAWGSSASGALGKLWGDLIPLQSLSLRGRIGHVREVACGTYHSMFLSTVLDPDEAKMRGSDVWICGSVGVDSDEQDSTEAAVRFGEHLQLKRENIRKLATWMGI